MTNRRKYTFEPQPEASVLLRMPPSTLHVYESSTGPYLSMVMADGYRGQGLRLTVTQVQLLQTVLDDFMSRPAEVAADDTQQAVS